MSIPISQFITPPAPPLLPPLVSIHLFSTSVSHFLPCKPVHLYHLPATVMGSWDIQTQSSYLIWDTVEWESGERKTGKENQYKGVLLALGALFHLNLWELCGGLLRIVCPKNRRLKHKSMGFRYLLVMGWPPGYWLCSTHYCVWMPLFKAKCLDPFAFFLLLLLIF